MHAIFLDEGRALAAAMLFKPYPQIVGDADVERSVPAAGEEIDIVVFIVGHGRNAANDGGYGSRPSPG